MPLTIRKEPENNAELMEVSLEDGSDNVTYLFFGRIEEQRHTQCKIL